jgi:hypothetical protein
MKIYLNNVFITWTHYYYFVQIVVLTIYQAAWNNFLLVCVPEVH